MIHRILLMLAALFCANMIDAAGAAEMITLRYGQNAASAGSLSSLPLTVAERKGFFVREGLNLEVIPIAGGTDRIVAALDKGEIDTGKNATPYLIQAVLKGSDAVAIVAQTTNPVYSLIVRPEIKSFADLKGKVLGLSTPGDTITLSTLRLLIRASKHPISTPRPSSEQALASNASNPANAPRCRWDSRKIWVRSSKAIRDWLLRMSRALI